MSNVEPERWRQVVDLFHAARESLPEERAALLEEAGKRDPLLQLEVEQMLVEDESAGDFLSRPVFPLSHGSLMPSLSAGRRVGHYRIVSKLGSGGMGIVYKAEDTKLKRPVAIKFVLSHPLGSGKEAERLLREAQAAAALQHANICPIHEINEADGFPYIAMAFLEGENLAQRIAGGSLGFAEAVSIAAQAAAGLQAAHEKGIIHRDIKPANLFINRQSGGRVHVTVLDFGLAQIAASSRLTHEGIVAGTTSYMSPEQCSGEEVDHRTDLWSLGVVLYEMVAGRRPFEGQTDAVVFHTITTRKPRLLTELRPDTPPELDRIVCKALAKRREQRYQNAVELIGDLESVARGRAAVEHTMTARRPHIRRAIIVGLLGIAIVFGWLWLGAQRSSKLSELRARPLTSQAGWEEWPAFSPDGERVAFTWAGKRNQSRQIYVKRLDADAPVQLTGSESERSISIESAAIGPLAWSPNGNRIAFKRQHGIPGAIYAISTQGGREIKLVDLLNANLSSSLDWSPDGAQIVFSDALPGTDRLAIYSFNVQTGEKRKLTSPPAEDWGDWDPKFSPDGKTLAFKRVRGYWLDAVYLMPAAGGPVRRVTKDSASIWGHDWMPKGDGLLVSTRLGGGIHELWRFPLSPGPESVRITRGGLEAITPVSSRNGSRIAWVNRLDDTNIYRVPLSGAGAPTQFIASTRRDEGASYSPDGSIAFASDRSGSWEIWIARSDGSNPLRVTNFGGPLAGNPRWSPDGRHLAFGVSREGHEDESNAIGRGRIFVLECPYDSGRCGEPKKLTGRSGAETWAEGLPSWSWDGAYVYFTSNRTGRNELWKQALAGGEAIQVTRTGGYSSSESYDGKWLYFSKAQSSGIWRMPGSRPEPATVSAGEQLLIGPPVDLLSTDWTLTRDEILFVGIADNRRLRGIRGYRLVSGRIRTILTISEMPESGTALSVSPDLRWLVYGQLDRSGSNIMVAEISPY